MGLSARILKWQRAGHKIDKLSHYWLKKLARVFPWLHLRGIQLHGGVLNTKARSARWSKHSVKDTTCHGACGRHETFNHILHICEVTHDPLVVEKEQSMIIMDVSVVATHRMQETWKIKVKKYGSPSNSDTIHAWKNLVGNIKHLPIILSSRGF